MSALPGPEQIAPGGRLKLSGQKWPVANHHLGSP